jgi:hypothetical protein
MIDQSLTAPRVEKAGEEYVQVLLDTGDEVVESSRTTMGGAEQMIRERYGKLHVDFLMRQLERLYDVEITGGRILRYFDGSEPACSLCKGFRHITLTGAPGERPIPAVCPVCNLHGEAKWRQSYDEVPSTDGPLETVPA